MTEPADNEVQEKFENRRKHEKIRLLWRLRGIWQFKENTWLIYFKVDDSAEIPEKLEII